MVLFKRLISLIHSIGYLALDIILLQHLTNHLYNVLSDVEVKVRVNEVIIVEPRIVSQKKLRIIGYYRTVEVVVASAFVQIIAHTRIEYEVNALIEKIFDMSVSELCRIAYRIRRDSVLTEIIHITGAFIGNDCSEAKRSKQHMPERKLFIEAESERESHNSAVTLRLMSLYCVEYAVILEFVEIRNGVPVRDAAALFTAVARYEASALAEADYIQLTVSCTAAAVSRARSTRKVFKLLRLNEL